MISRIISYLNRKNLKITELQKSLLKAEFSIKEYKEIDTSLRDLIRELNTSKASLESKLESQIAVNLAKDHQIKQLKDIYKTIPVVKVNHEDPAPTDEGARSSYMSNFSKFYVDLLKPKIFHLIAQVREELDWNGLPNEEKRYGLVGMSRVEFDAFLRGTSNAFKLLLEYGDQCVNEDADYKNKQSLK